MTREGFPDGFTFGAATASYQIEGAVGEGGRGPSIWDTFTHTPGAVADGATGDVACDHYHRFQTDLDLLAELGVDAYRFSIAWPRIQPAGVGRANQAGLDFYSRLVDGLLALGIRPFVTLYHWDLPQALEDKGGWLDRDTAFRFADYADLVARELGDRVADWATLNEPWCIAMLGYASGVHAPGRRGPEGGLRASHHLNLAHGLAVPALRASSAGRVGVVVNYHQFYPATDSPDDEAAVGRVDAIGNWIYTEPMLAGRYDPLTREVTRDVATWDFVADGDLARIQAPLDFLGLNYYAPAYLAASVGALEAPNPWPGAVGARWVAPRPPLTTMGWSVEPAGLTDLLVKVHARYGDLDLVVTENGSAFPDVVGADGTVHDPARVAYLRDHLEAVSAAIGRGVPVTGYYAWSLMDNFEWAFGFSQRFGLYRVDYATQVRTPKDSALWYQRFLSGI
ncbi:MAG: GH1 family beta-glucosidase [Actinomycetia bacterium]|nr:GH1 family beta-glucosidase [Actinomycetes bacterium]